MEKILLNSIRIRENIKELEESLVHRVQIHETTLHSRSLLLIYNIVIRIGLLLLIPLVGIYVHWLGFMIVLWATHKRAKLFKENEEYYYNLKYAGLLFGISGNILSVSMVVSILIYPMIMLSNKASFEANILLMPAIIFSLYILYKVYKAVKILEDKYLNRFGIEGNSIASIVDDISSYPNKKIQEDGYQWSTIKEIKDFRHGKVYIDNFTTFDKMEEIITNKHLLVEAKKQDIYIDRTDFTKTLTVLGSMGSGKTEFFHSLLNQGTFNREIIHDIKGDFVEKWYNEDTDYILNPYDKRGVYWDLWAEMEDNEALVESFINNLMQAHTEEKDFFTGSAKKVIIDMFLKTHYTTDGNSSHKWDILLEEIETYKIATETDKTKGSIYATMVLVIELFTFMAWHSKQNKKSFTIKEYLESNGKLFLLNNPSVTSKITPLFTGFTSMLTEILLSKRDTEDNLTLILLDEYLSMSFEKQTRLKLLTQIRSKGGCLIMGMQYLPKKDKEHQQLIDSSSYGRLIFQLNDQETINHIVTSMGEINFLQSSISAGVSYSKEGSSANESINQSIKNKKLLTTKHLQSMPKYSHISVFFSDTILYLGYTPQVEGLEAINENFTKTDQKAYYTDKYTKQKDDEIEKLKAEIEELKKG